MTLSSTAIALQVMGERNSLPTYRRELENDIEPFKGLLLGLFFIAVGMSIDFSVLINYPWLIACVLLAFIAIKFIVIYGLLKVVDLAKEHFPQLQLVVRARDATHWNKLRDREPTFVQRELFESSLHRAGAIGGTNGARARDGWKIKRFKPIHH